MPIGTFAYVSKYDRVKIKRLSNGLNLSNIKFSSAGQFSTLPWQNNLPQAR
jgi:hypothetical protein